MEGFVGEEKEFVFNAVLDWEPMELFQDGCDVVSGPGASEEACSRVLNIL